MLLEHNEVSLRHFNENDIENKIRWINDCDNNIYLHYDIPLEYGKTLNWFNNKNNQTRIDCIIEYNSIPVGLIGLTNVDTNNFKAEYYICLGEKEYKRKGISETATCLLLNYAFEHLKLNKIYLNVDSENTAACRLYEKVGFLCEGEFFEDLFHRNHYINRKRYAMLSKNYKKR